MSFGGGGAALRGKTNGFRSFLLPSPAVATAAFTFAPSFLLGDDLSRLPSPFCASAVSVSSHSKFCSSSPQSDPCSPCTDSRSSGRIASSL